MIDYQRECEENYINLIYKDINCKGAFVNYKSTNIIVLNPNLTLKQRNCVACEELGHFYTKSTYNINCIDLNYISKQEYKAKKYAFEKLAPFDLIKKLAEKYDIDEICEKLDITEEFLSEAYNYYVNKYGI